MMPGMIMLWHGEVVDIPSGWHLCDGTMGTPDLVDKFVCGAGDIPGPNETGGNKVHAHPFTGDGHAHDMLSGDLVVVNQPLGNLAYTTTTVPASGDTDNQEHVPPYHTLCYIMKLN